MSKHTPGPWGLQDGRGVELFAADGEPLMTLLRGTEEIWANTRLIAAAPELLEACRNALGVIGLPLHPNDIAVIQAELRAAIAKAESVQ